MELHECVILNRQIGVGDSKYGVVSDHDAEHAQRTFWLLKWARRYFDGYQLLIFIIAR